MRIVIDTETTGLDPAQDEILQLSIIDADTREVIFNELIKPKNHDAWEGAQRVNHISPEDVADKMTIDWYTNEIFGIFRDCTEIIGYNTYFDLGFLKEIGLNPPYRCKIIDVMQDFANLHGEWSDYHQGYKWIKLVEAAAAYNYKWDEAPAHNALGDVYATLYVHEHLQRELDELEDLRELDPEVDPRILIF